MTYGVPVWYTGRNQKGRWKKFEKVQNEGTRKMLGVFKTTPVKPLNNLTGIPPIPYLFDKLLNAYTRRLKTMPPNALVCTVLEADQCRIWPEYFTPLTNLHVISRTIGTPTYRPLGPCTAGLWTHPRLVYNPNPLESTIRYHKEALIHPAPGDTYVFTFHFLHPAHGGTHMGCFFVYQNRRIIHSGCARG